MFDNSNRKSLIKIIKDFTASFDDELTVKKHNVAQYVNTEDRFWCKIFFNGQTGKVPISCCIDYTYKELETLRIVKPDQAVFVANHDFCHDYVEGDLRFSYSEILIGLKMVDNDWWFGTRLNSVQHKTNLCVEKNQCGIFPITYVWRLQDDLLPDYIFDSSGVILLNNLNEIKPNNSKEINTIDDLFQEKLKKLNNESHSTLPTDDDDVQFYVEVVQTMKAQLDEEIDLPVVGEMLCVISIPDKMYYFGKSIDGLRKGIFPKNFVKVVEKTRDSTLQPPSNNIEGCSDENIHISSSSSISESPIPPSISPPPLPGCFSEQALTHQNNQGMKTFVDDPPSYDVAIKLQSLTYGYANHMFNEVVPYGRVLFDFEAQDSSELTLHENEIVHLHRHIDEGWIEGEINGKIGLFPKNYISIIVDCEPLSQPSESITQNQNFNIETEEITKNNQNLSNQVEAIDYPPDSYAKILYDFDGEMEQDLKVRAGDIVKLLRRFTSTNWVEAMDSANVVGFVHLNLCELVDYSVAPKSSSINDSQDEKPSCSMGSQELRYPHIDVNKSLESSSKDICLKDENLKNMPDQTQNYPNQNKSHRPAPPVPKNTVFPTFNQFLLQEKAELYQLDIEQSHQTDPSNDSSNNIKSPEIAKTQSQNQRQCVITELIQTEKDYLYALKVFVRVFEMSDDEAEKCDIDIEKICFDMKKVINVSKQMIKLLENFCHNRSYEDQKVGICFLDLKFELNEAYTRYCRNHESTNATLNFYKTNSKSKDYIQKCLNKMKEQTNCFDISSMLIKPVQRILKYPLLLNELIKYTESDHVDSEGLHLALQMITSIATNINEHKRRHDLIRKYCKSTDISLSDRLKNLNMHTVKKKSSRFSYRIMSTLKFSSGTKDKNYEIILHKFRSVEKTIRTFLKNFSDYLHYLDMFYVQSMVLIESVKTYYDSKMNDKNEIESIKINHRTRYLQFFNEFKISTEKDVLQVLNKLLEKFSAPLKLINKREDKRIDYETSLKSKTDFNLAKNNFEAINQQLIDELPILTEGGFQIFFICIQTLLLDMKKLICKTANLDINLYELPFVKNTPFEFYQDIEEGFRVKNTLILEEIMRGFSLIHKSVFSSGNNPDQALSSTLNRISINRKSNTWKHAMPINKYQQNNTDTTNEMKKQDQNAKEKIKSRFKPQDIYIVISTCQPFDVLEIFAEVNDLVGVIKRQDPMGQEHRWYVDRGVSSGFVLCKNLAPYHNNEQWIIPSVSSSKLCSIQQSILDLPIDQSFQREPHRYDMVPDEGSSSGNTSLLSFDEPDLPTCSSNKMNQDITSEFDPLFSSSKPYSTNQQEKNSRPNSSISVENVHTNSKANMDEDQLYFCAYRFQAGDQNQLSMEFGQAVKVLQKADLSGNTQWWLVKNSSGQTGYVPANYLKRSSL